ncbi:MAG: hypothetical protein PHD06_08015 [Bacteroidales bacterium]|jgi:hypothetical protein|nr:hypothetical protein [Bacteroidales bacterium]MDD4385111.1 hypothetical protein [Bacteroidales bacterium]MDY0197530.1 hypothetical protein [Tenuifilaceae bacterium]
MHQNSTTLLWIYQQYNSSLTDDSLLLSNLYEPIDVFQNLLKGIDDSTLDIPGYVLTKILESI